ncbi:ABC transporter transmembrane domain-containing protein [Mangrovicella endophytica]|uniref:ABC transporter transmembrane domain-containing protein n=1 Tax=Mangrovicella endophytica TaxID=2066697 RepID=UPI000C9DCBD2|nr:ABC transporter transmembrane domain-containing protein [Mangrovicella endophytica]
MAESLYSYVWRHTRRQQLWMLLVVLLSIPFLYVSLDLPKAIINGPIQGEGFEAGATTLPTYLRTTVPLPDGWFGLDEIVLFPGVQLDRMQALFILSGLFLAFVVINGAFKFYINIYKGRLGERMLRRLRYEMVDRLLRFPIRQFRQLRPPEVASMIKDELEPIGGFIGDAFVTPLFLMSQVLTSMVFIFVQSFTLGLVALAVTGLQIIVIPKMRRRLLVLGRERQLTARQLSGRIGEIIDGIASVHANDTSNFERAGISADLGHIFLIRFDIYQWKFFVKFLNNFLSQATPFIFYLFGGYFAITGQLDIGQLVAVIAAYRELPSPLKDLIDWDLARLDVAVKYDQVIEQFDIKGISDAALQAPVHGDVESLSGSFVLHGISTRDDAGTRLLEDVSVELPLTERTAAYGMIGDGAGQLAEILARLNAPTNGEVLLADRPLKSYGEATTGRRIAYAEATPFYPQSTLRDALLYPLKRRPVAAVPRSAGKRERLAQLETLAAGNSPLDPRDEWVDFKAAGASSAAELERRIAEVLKIVMLERDVQRFGLAASVPPEYQSRMAEPILHARVAFREQLAAAGMGAYVEPFDPARYMNNAGILENVVFGAARSSDAETTWMLTRSHVRQILQALGLVEPFLAIGREIAATMVDLFGDLEPGSPLLRRITIMRPEELATYRQILSRTDGKSFDEIADADRLPLIRLAFNYVEPRDRLGLLDDALRQRIVEARATFQENATAEIEGAIAFHEAGAYNPAASIQDNVLFGRIAQDMANAAEAVEQRLLQTLGALGLSELVQKAGLRYDLGSGAKRLSLAQQQKLGLARGILKSPDYLIANRCLSALDADTQGKIIAATLRRSRDPDRPFGTFWVLSGADQASMFERFVEFKDGRLVNDRKIEQSQPASALAAE